MKYKNIIFGIILGVILCSAEIASADIANKNWSYSNYASEAYTLWHKKDTNGNVYCYPYAGGKVYATVGKSTNGGKTHSAASKKVKLNMGTKYTIVNSVGKNYARLKFNRVSTDGTVNSGYWSPDSSKNYTVVGK